VLPVVAPAGAVDVLVEPAMKKVRAYLCLI